MTATKRGSRATAQETPFYELRPGRRGSVAMYSRSKDWALIDALLPRSTGRPALESVLQSLVKNGTGGYSPSVADYGRKISIDACVPAAIARAIIDLIQPPRTAA